MSKSLKAASAKAASTKKGAAPAPKAPGPRAVVTKTNAPTSKVRAPRPARAVTAASRAAAGHNDEALNPETNDLRVRALVPVFYGLKRRREGDVFTLADEKHYNPKRHAWVSSRTQERTTAPNAHLKRLHDEKLAGGKAPSAADHEAEADRRRSTGLDPIGE